MEWLPFARQLFLQPYVLLIFFEKKHTSACALLESPQTSNESGSSKGHFAPSMPWLP